MASLSSEPVDRIAFQPSVLCSVTEQGVLGTQCVGQPYGKVTIVIVFEEWLQLGAQLRLPRHMPSPLLVYDEVSQISTAWRMAMMLTSSLQHFRIGSRFVPSTVDDLHGVLESVAEEGAIERLQQDFGMCPAKFAEFVDFWNTTQPDPAVFLDWLGALDQASPERCILGSALRFALSEGDIEASPALIAQLNEDAATGDYCSDDMALDGFWPESGEG